MLDDPKAAIITIIIVSLLAFAVGCVMGSLHVGEEYSQELIPTSLTSSDDMIKPIKETNTTMYNVSIKQPQQKKVVKNYTKNTTNNTTSNDSGVNTTLTSYNSTNTHKNNNYSGTGQ